MGAVVVVTLTCEFAFRYFHLSSVNTDCCSWFWSQSDM